MANQTGPGNLTGTADDDIIIGTGSNQTINGLAGNDVLIGDRDTVFVDASAGNNSIANATNIDADTLWSTQPNPDLGDDSVPYTTIMATGSGEMDYFEVTVGIGETITLDVDYAIGSFGGPGFDSVISLRDASDILIPGAFNDDGGNENGGLGSGPGINRDSFLTHTNSTGSVQTYYIRVEQFFTGAITAGNTYLLNVSVTNHANTNNYATGIDTINGGDDDDIIYGMEGDDILNGDAGNDFIEGGLGADTMDGGAGTGDTLSYSSSSAGVTADLLFNTYSGGDAAGDIVSNFENIVGSAFSDVLRGAGTGISSIRGGAGSDNIISGGSTSTGQFFGEAGNDFIQFQANFDATGYIIDGGADTDTLRLFSTGASTDFRTATVNRIETLQILNSVGSNREAIFYANQFTMTTVTNGAHVGQTHQVSLFMDISLLLDISAVTFTGFTEPGDQVNITGDGDGEAITGASNVANIIDGGGGNDIIEGGTGDDTLDGGAGTGDTLSYANAGGGVSISVSFAGPQVTGGAGTDTVSNFENLIGSTFNDVLAGTSGANIIHGGAGADTLTGFGGLDSLFGEAGNDRLLLDDTDDVAGLVLNGGDDDDKLEVYFHSSGSVNLRDDTLTSIETLEINDFSVSGSIDVQINASQLVPSVVNVVLDDDVDATTLSIFMDTPTILDLSAISFTGASLPDSGVNVTGDGDDETITGSSVRDNINAGGGDDTLNVGPTGIVAGETYDGGAGSGDELNFTALTTAHTVNLETGVFDLVAGGAASTVANIEIVRAGSGNDVLERGSSATIISLFGGAGDDRIGPSAVGIAAGDIFDGGTGTDTLDFLTVVPVGHRVNLALQEFDTVGGGFLATAANFENIDAGGGDDNLTGDGGINIINGGGGNDTIDSGEGVDIVNGEAGDDTILLSALSFSGGEAYDGGADTDTIQSVAGLFYTDTSLFDLAAGTFDIGGPTTATFVNFENYDGSAGTAASSENVTGTTGNNIISTAGGTNTIDGGSDGADILSGGGGDDIIFGGGNGTVMNGGAGNDTLTASSNTIHDQTLNGDAGNDLIIVGYSSVGDIYDGGADIDTVDFQMLESFSGESIDLSSGSFTLFGGLYSNFENVNDTDNFGGNIIIGSAVANIINGNGGNDFISGGAGHDTINGGTGNDTLDGGVGFDTVNGDAGNDTIMGSTQADVIDGGADTDTVDYSGATNTQKINLVTNVNIGGFAHGDMLSNVENVVGSATNGDDITGTAGINTLSGLGADDLLRGHHGDDTLNGGDNNDFLFGGTGADTLDGGNGNDWAMYNGLTVGVTVNLLTGLGSGGQADGDTYANIERVRGSLMDDTITGTDGINKLLGDGGADTINGMGGKDVIRGGDGDDTINGGAGNDGLRGDAGSDTFIFELGSGHDFVIDFEDGIDTLNIDDALYGGGLTIEELVNDHMVMENANRFHFDFGNGDVLHVLTTSAMVLNDFYDDIVIV